MAIVLLIAAFWILDYLLATAWNNLWTIFDLIFESLYLIAIICCVRNLPKYTIRTQGRIIKKIGKIRNENPKFNQMVILYNDTIYFLTCIIFLSTLLLLIAIATTYRESIYKPGTKIVKWFGDEQFLKSAIASNKYIKENSRYVFAATLYTNLHRSLVMLWNMRRVSLAFKSSLTEVYNYITGNKYIAIFIPLEIILYSEPVYSNRKGKGKAINRWDIKIIGRFIKYLLGNKINFQDKNVSYNDNARKAWFTHYKRIQVLKKIYKLMEEVIEAQSFSFWNNYLTWKYAVEELSRMTPDVKPFPRLPNVGEFKVESVERYHPILKLGGIYKRMGKASFDKIPYKNKRMNRYLDHMEKTLNRRVGSPEFWTLGKILLTRSTAFRLAQLRQIEPRWYKNTELKSVKKLISDYNNLNLDKFLFKRIDIPKPGTNKMRPLGVPTTAWRLHQTGWNMLLLIWTKTFQHPYQHGFRPSQGTGTAWQQIHSDVIPSKYIYEFDLDKFFDRVNLDYLSKRLRVLGIPEDIILMLINWSRIPPRSLIPPRNNNKANRSNRNKKFNFGKRSIHTKPDYFNSVFKNSTDLTWQSELELSIHQQQHSSLKANEYDYYSSVRQLIPN